jgi:hypothetical protein
MIIERSGQKFYAPDGAVIAIDGEWKIDDSALVSYDVWESQQNLEAIQVIKDSIQAEIDALIYADKTVDNNALDSAVAVYNELIAAEEIALQTQIEVM